MHRAIQDFNIPAQPPGLLKFLKSVGGASSEAKGVLNW